MSEDGGTKPTSSGHDDTVPASNAGAPERSSIPTIPPPPDTRYQLGQELGRGGMGRVVEAYDTHLRRTVALKEVLPKMANIDRRFQREVRITARLEHASIVPLYDSGRLADGRPFYVMRRVTGKPLDQVIARARTHEGRLALLPNMLAAIDAIAHAHKRGVIHRDLKPQNILVGELGETVVIDWGLAKVLGDGDEPVHDSLEPRLPSAADSLQTQIGSVFGTPGFMAPEQARGDDLGPPGDVYALGATLYQLIVGKPPFGGTSATDVISSTLRHRLEPVARAAPGTPPELVTIIEKALAFEPKDRYPDAGALAEDVRRFLTGQLVAAHQYTPRQRVSRLVRRHRAALTVAALAVVGIAALAVFSIRSIVRERDAAKAASAEAERQRTNADKQARQSRERADQLLLLHARTLLETNPTHAMAALKQIESDNAIVRMEAVALGRAAAMRGVAWGMPASTDMTSSLEMTSDGERVLHMTVSGALQVIDLDTRRKVFSYSAPPTSQAYWVDNSRKILVKPRDQPMVLVDPTTGRSEPVSGLPAYAVSITDDGSRVAYFDRDARLMLLDVATGTTRPVGELVSRRTSTFEIAPDGSWIALDRRIDGKTSRLVVVDLDGKILYERDSAPSLMGTSASGKLAVKLWDEMIEVDGLPAKPVATTIPLDEQQQHILQMPFYIGEKLHLMSYRAVHAWTGKAVIKLRDLPDGVFMARPVAGDGVLFLNGDPQLILSRDGVEHTLQVTSRPNVGPVRVACVRGGSRIVATGYDALQIFDVDAFMPRRMPALNDAAFITESVLIQPAGMMHTWSWVDVTSGKVTDARLATGPGFVRTFEVGPDRRTLSVIDKMQDSNKTTVVTATPGRTETDIAIEGILGGLATLVDGGILYVRADRPETLLVKRGTTEPVSLVTLDSPIRSIRRTSPTTYAALGTSGDLVRGRIDGTGLERTRLEKAPEGMFLTSDPSGTVIVVDGKRLLRWTTTVEELAQFSGDIRWVLPLRSGTLVGLSADEMTFLAQDAAPPRRVNGLKPSVATEGARIVSVNPRSEIEIAELPSLITWTLPKMYRPLGFIAVSPSGNRIYQNVGAIGMLWTIPEPGSDFRAWLDEQTNAVEIDRIARWSWQVP